MPTKATCVSFAKKSRTTRRSGANASLTSHQYERRKTKYIYPVIFTQDGDEKYYARVPDLPNCITTGNSRQDAIEGIADAASIWLVCAEDNGLSIPSANNQRSMGKAENCIFSLIQVDTVAYRSEIDTRFARKMSQFPFGWQISLRSVA